MLNLLEWVKPLRVNGVIYPNSETAWEALKGSAEEIKIELNFTPEEEEKPAETVEQEEAKEKEPELKWVIKIPPWLAKKHNCTTTLRGEITAESAKAIYVEAYSIFTETVTCRVCGRALTNPLSITRGIGPICMEKVFGFSYKEDEADLDRACMEAEEKVFRIWLPKSYATYAEFIKPV